MQNTPSSEHSDTDLFQGQMGTSPQWPGERRPTRWDVHDANESLGTTFLECYKTALLQSEQGQSCSWLIPPPDEDELQNSGTQAGNAEPQNNPVRLYTYPMALLTEISSIPEEAEVSRLQSSFFTSFKQHIYLAAIDIPNTTQSLHPPYFPLTLACLSSAVSPGTNLDAYDLGEKTSQAEVSSSLFIAGFSLWCVVLEVDNRETRFLEAVVAV